MVNMQTKWVSVLAFTIEPDDLHAFARSASIVMERRIPVNPGFVEGLVMANETKTRVLIVTQWESKNAWASSQWDQGLLEELGDLAESAKEFEYYGYEPITVVHGAPVP